MYNNFKFIITMMLCFYAYHFQAQTTENQSRLQGIENPVITETTLHFTYNPEGGPLEGLDKIEGVVYLFKDYKWEIADVKLNKNNTLWDGEFTIPKNCAFLAFKFLSNTDQGIVTDTNVDAGFIYAPLNNEGGKSPGSDLAWGTFRNAKFNQQFGNYFKDFTIFDEASEFWIKKEIKDHADKLPFFIATYIKLAEIRKPDDYIPFGNNILKRFLKDYPNLSESQYIDVKNLFAFTLKNQHVADSLQEVILNKFPKGIEKRFLEFQKLNTITNVSERLASIQKFLANFPCNESVPEDQNYIYNKIYQDLFSIYFEAKAYNEIEAIIPNMNFYSLNDSYHNNISKAFHFKSVKTKILLRLSKLMINQMMDKTEDLSYMSGLYWTPNQAKQNAVDQLDRKLNTHIRLLYAEGEYSAALTFFDVFSSDAQYSNSATNELNMFIAEKLNKPILPILKKSASKNALTPLMIERLKEQYIKSGHKQDGFNLYLEGLKTKNVFDISESLKSRLINIACPKFTLEDSKRSPVEISGNQNEILVIDFWATWCGPCKKSFPGMKMIVDKFKNDPNVRFYFISTMETREGYIEEAEAYMKKKAYHFNLLYDLKPTENHINNATFKNFASIFNSSGIPRKVVVKNGRIRYTSEGYSGNPSELSDELNAVIEILKAEK